MLEPLKYRSLPAQQELVMDETDTIVVGFELSVTLTAHGITHTKKALYTLPEADRFPFAQSGNMAFFAEQVTKAQLAINLPQEAEAELTAKLEAAGIEVAS